MTKPAVRMTSSLAAEMFADTAKLMSTRQLTETRLDMLQCSDVDIHVRLCLGEASDAIKVGNYSHPAVVRCFEAFNRLCRG